MKSVLFVCYGSGHVRMVVPVAHELIRRRVAQVKVLGLTTAAPAVAAAGLPLLQFKDFQMDGDAAALARGHELAAALGPVADPHESAAYLGLSYRDLVEEVGEEQAADRYRREGRQAFLPVRTLERVLRHVMPDLLVATNSPRAERAAILAARRLGIPAVCIVDLFAVDEVRWIGAPDYADRVCVLNEQVRQFLVAAGRSEAQVVVTGNPAFDALSNSRLPQQAAALRQANGWQGKRVLLYPSQTEPVRHPFDGRPGDPALPAHLLRGLVSWVTARDDSVLCIRPRAGEAPPSLPVDARIVVTGQDWDLPPLLHAADLVVTLSSTVGLEGFLAGSRVLQVLGSVFDAAMPLARFGLADEAVPLDRLPRALDHWSAMPRRPAHHGESATARVAEVLAPFL